MIRWLQKTVALRWVILPLVFGITVYMAYLSASRLTDDSGTLIFDTSLDNYLSKGRDSYRFFLQVTEMFGDDQFILMATQPPAGSGPDAEFFLELDAMSADIRRQVPGVKEVLSVINTPQFLTSCVGDSHFYFEAPGSVCVSLLEQLQAAHKCWDEHPQGLAAPTGSAAAGPAADDPDGPVFFSGGEDGSREEAPQAASASDTPPPTDGNEEEPVFFPGGKSTAPDPAPASTGMEKPVAGNPPAADGEEDGPVFFGGEAGPAAIAPASRSAGPSDPARRTCTPDVFTKSRQDWTAHTNFSLGETVSRMGRDPFISGDLVSADGRTYGVLISFASEDDALLPQVQNALAEIVKARVDKGLPTSYVGQSRQQYEASRVLARDFWSIMPISISIMLMVFAFMFRSPVGMVIPLLLVGTGLIWTTGFFAISGKSLNPLSIVLAPLLICVGSGYVIYFLSQYFSKCRESSSDKEGIISDTQAGLTVPLTVTALTTISGFAALTVSPIPAVKTLGIYASLGVAILIFLNLVFVPPLLSLFPRPVQKKEVEKKGLLNLLESVLGFINFWVESRSRNIIYVWLGIGALAATGLPLVTVNSDNTAFGPEAPISRDMNMVEDNLGGTSILWIMLGSADRPWALATGESMRKLETLSESWAAGKGKGLEMEGIRIDKVYSPVPFLNLRYGSVENLSQSEVMSLLDMAGQNNGPRFFSKDGHWLRLTIRMRTEGSRSLLELRELLRGQLAEAFPEAEIRFTGSGILTMESADNVARSQIQSVALALVIIFGIMSAMFMSFRMGLIALYPNVLAILVFFGVLGWFNIPLGVTISIIAAIALGIGVDDTIHYLAHYNTNVKRLRNERQAAVLTMRQMGRPMISTTIALALGFLVMMLSEMETQRLFGSLLAFTLVVCLLTDLNFLPSIMASTRLITAWDYLSLGFSQESISRIPLFRDMSLRETKLTTLMAFPMELNAGQVVFHEGDVGRELYVILEGEVEVYFDARKHGEEHVLATLGVGGTFGEMALFRHSRRGASVRVTKKAELLAINDTVLEKLRERYPQIASKLFLNLARNLAAMARRSQDLFLEKISLGKAREDYIRSLRNTEDALAAAVDEIIADGVVTPDEMRKLEKTIYADGYVTKAEQRQFDRLKRMINLGKVTRQAAFSDSMFFGLNKRQETWLLSNFKERQLIPTEEVWRMDDDRQYMAIVLRGTLSVQKGSRGHALGVRTVLPGDIFGEETLLLEIPGRQEKVISLDAARILVIEKDDWEKFLQSKHRTVTQFAYNLVCMLSLRLQEINEKQFK